MIKVNILVKDNFISEVKIKGHAKYDEYGKDIVCASVSSIVITTVNAIISLNKDALIYTQDKDLLTINIQTTEKIVDTLITNMINLLKELQSKYPKNIQVKEELK